MRSPYSRFAAIAPLVIAALALATPASAQFGGLKKRLKAKAAEQGVSKAAEAAGAPQETAGPNARGGTVVLTADVVSKLLTGLKAGEAERASAAKEDTPYGRYHTAKAAYVEGKAKCEAAQPGFIQKMSANKKLSDKYSAFTDKMVAAQAKGDTRLMIVYQDSAMAMQDPGCVVKEPKQPEDFYAAERQVETRSDNQAVKASGLGAGEFAMAKERADGILRGPAPADASPVEQSAVSAHAAELKPLLGIQEQPAARAMKTAPAPAPAAAAAPTMPQVSPAASQMSACMANNVQTHQAKIAALGERAQAAQAAGDNPKLMAIADTIHQIQVAGCQGR
jgi:hypothetical protein